MGTGQRWRPIVLGAAVAACGIAATAIAVQRHLAGASTAGAPSPTGAAGPWAVHCAGDQPPCTLDQAVLYRRDAAAPAEPLMQVSVGNAADDGRRRMVLTLPLGIAVQPGIGFRIDQSAPETAPIESCQPGGCRVVLVVDRSGLARLEASRQIEISYTMAGGQQTVLPIVLDGFAAGLERLTSAANGGREAK